MHTVAVPGEVVPLTRRELDLTDAGALRQTIHTLRPAAVMAEVAKAVGSPLLPAW